MNNNSFSSFLDNYRRTISEIFSGAAEGDGIYLRRGLPEGILKQILDHKPLSVFIPREYGGRGAQTYEGLAMLEASSYESLPLSLMMGINGALFLQPVGKYGHDDIRGGIFKRFMEERNMGGLMITEPGHGSDALRMQTGFSRADGHYRVSGLKHWAGLTGQADFWLITAREKGEDGELGRDMGFFVHDAGLGGIEVEEYFNNLGLYMLPYGRNKIDIRVPGNFRLQPRSTGVTMMLDLLHRSRLQFPGMATGYLHRILDESVAHCKKRFVGGASLFSYDQVKERLAHLQAWFTASSAMSFFTAGNIHTGTDTSRLDLVANSVKSVITDYMQSAAQSFLQLAGAAGYRLDHLAGRSVVDSRPFQIFEGSNDILYQQITESVLKLMRKMQLTNLYEFLNKYGHTEKAAGYFKELLSFEVDFRMAQRKMVELGRAIGRLVTMNMTIELGSAGFNPGMISSAVKVMRQEIDTIIASYNFREQPGVTDDYGDNSNWLECLSPEPATAGVR